MKHVVQYQDYTIYRNDESVSITGNFKDKEEIACTLFKIAEERKKEKPVRKEYKGMTLMAEDYGPARFCKSCESRLIERWDNKLDINVYVHPDNDCGVYISEMILGDDEMTSGIANHKNLTMDDLKDVYRKHGGKWMHDNKDILKQIYQEHADDAVTLEQPDDGWTYQENKFMKFVSSNMLFRHNHVLRENKKKYDKGIIRESLYLHVKELVNYAKDIGFFHPKAVRRRKFNDVSWESIKKEVSLDNMVCNQDWELESRQHLAQLYI